MGQGTGKKENGVCVVAKKKKKKKKKRSALIRNAEV